MNKSLLKRAIEDTPDPTPGYLFRDIAQWTFVDQATQEKLIAALFDKLTPKGSPHVLAKVLRIVKVLCEMGHADFQKEMQHRSDQMKDYASYRGPQHPQLGDRLNEKVRVAAKEAVEAAFSARKDSKVQICAGHGSDTTTKDGGKGAFSTNNPVTVGGDGRVAAMPTTNKWADHMAKAGAGGQGAQVIGDIVSQAKLGFGFFGSESIKSKEDRMREATTDHGEFKPVDIALVGAGRGPFGPVSGDNSPSAGGAGGGWRFTDDGAAADLPPIEQHATLGRFMTPFEREVERVAQFKNAPQRVDLTQFVAAVKEIHDRQGMAYEDLAQALDANIAQKHPWQARLNVMTLIEHVLKADLSADIGEYFNENPEDVQRNVHVVQSSLKEKSQKVLRLLGIPERSSAPAPPTAAPEKDAIDFSAMTVTRRRRGKGDEREEAGRPSAELGGSMHSDGPLPDAKADPTKLRRRAPMQEPSVAPPQTVPAPAVSAPVADPWASAGWGGSDAGWGSNVSTNGDWQSPAAASPVAPAQPVLPAQSAAPKDDFDAFFGSSSNKTVTQPPAVATPAPPAPVAVAVPPPAPADPLMAMLGQMQTLMASIDMTNPNAAAQLQMLMAQQQQLMSLIQQRQQAPVSSTPGAPPPQPASSSSGFQGIDGPALRRNEEREKNFADVQQQMVSMLMKNGPSQ